MAQEQKEDVKIYVVYKGTRSAVDLSYYNTVEEVRSALELALDTPERIVGLYEPRRDVVYPLTTVLCEASLYYNNYSLVLSHSGVDYESCVAAGLAFDPSLSKHTEIPEVYSDDEPDTVQAPSQGSYMKDVDVTMKHLENLRKQAGFDRLEPWEVFGMFRRAAPHGYMDRKTFWNAFSKLVPMSGTEDEWVHAQQVLSRLFNLFDKDGNGVVDNAEFCAGLQVLCGGSRDDKIKLVFAAFDVDGDGYIDRSEMTSYLNSFFHALLEFSPAMKARLAETGITAEMLGVSTAAQCFAEADILGDGRINFEEFKRWYSSPSAVPFVKGGDNDGDLSFIQHIAEIRDQQANMLHEML